MAREVVTAVFQVVGARGHQLGLREITTYVSGRLIGGGESVDGVVYRLDNGKELQAFLGGVDFIDRATGESYKRV